MKKTAVLLMAYGGPDKLEDVAPYLLDVRGGRPASAERVEEMIGRYAAIGGFSPLLPITRRVAKKLETNLQAQFGKNIQTFVGMRHWFPYIHETVTEIVSLGFERMITMCMTPFDSRLTTQVYFDHLTQALDKHEFGRVMQVIRIPGWYQQHGFVEVLARKLKETLALFDKEKEVSVFFTAHSLPASILEEGDPYPQQFFALAKLAAQAADLPAGSWQNVYQCAGGGRIPWLGPDLETEVKKLNGSKTQQVLVAPIGFLCDHVEILYDLDIELIKETRDMGLTIRRTQSLNDDADFIESLTERIKQELP